MHLLGCPRLEVNALEAAESQQRRTFHRREFQIELHDFVSRHSSRVANGYIRREGITRLHRRLREAEIAVTEGRVTQAIAEGIQRLSVEVAVGAAFHRIVLKVGKLADILVEGYRKAPRRIVLAAQGLGNCRSAFLSGIPRFQDGVSVFAGPVYG